MNQQNHFGFRRGQALWLALSLAGMVACEEEEPSSAGDAGGQIGQDGSTPIPGADGSIPGFPTSDSGVTPGADGGTPPATGGDGGSATPTDSAWCKAKAVLDTRCNACHGATPAAGAPMSLATYENTQGMAPVTTTETVTQAIKRRIHMTQGAMPPGGGLSADQLGALDAWIDGGAQPGPDKTCAGNAPTGPSAFEWPAECTPERRYKILAHGATPTTPLTVAPGVETHPQVPVDAPWGDAEVQSFGMVPITDNAKVLHHWILYSSSSAFVTGWAPGEDKKLTLPDDVGLYLPSGKGSMRLDMHYNNLPGKETESDQSGVEICAVPKAMAKPKTATVTMLFGANGAQMAPANANMYENKRTCTIYASQPVHLLSSSPHAHTLAKAMKFTATVGGKQVTLHEGPFDFEEQKMYPINYNGSPEIILNTGDTVSTSCFYTNPTNRAIDFGENTGDEMCFNFAIYYPKDSFVCL